MKPSRLAYHLRNYPGKDYMVDGFKHGFTLHFEGHQCEITSPNSLSTLEYHDQVSSYLEKELYSGRVSGPYKQPPLPNFKVSPLSVRPKTEGKIRMLHNLSAPYNNEAVNFNIPDNFASVK